MEQERGLNTDHGSGELPRSKTNQLPASIRNLPLPEIPYDVSTMPQAPPRTSLLLANEHEPANTDEPNALPDLPSLPTTGAQPDVDQPDQPPSNDGVCVDSKTATLKANDESVTLPKSPPPVSSRPQSTLLRPEKADLAAAVPQRSKPPAVSPKPVSKSLIQRESYEESNLFSLLTI